MKGPAAAPVMAPRREADMIDHLGEGALLAEGREPRGPEPSALDCLVAALVLTALALLAPLLC